uniref:DUF4637 domain-containing protein n=1 Tax=Cyanoderma ruficeps TaxID=181631 RepID=A0A8C3NRP1_9PASS
MAVVLNVLEPSGLTELSQWCGQTRSSPQSALVHELCKGLCRENSRMCNLIRRAFLSALMSAHRGQEPLMWRSTGPDTQSSVDLSPLCVPVAAGHLPEPLPACHLCACCSPQGRSQLAEDKRRCLHRKGSRRPKEEPCSLRQAGGRQRSGKMCPSCEILLCRPCGTLHSQRGFIAHSLLDHYDTAALPC